ARTYNDVCPYGGPGNGNGVVDPGETITMPLTITNDGPATITGISGVLSSSSAAVTITDSSATWPTLAPAASAPSNPDHFTFNLATTATCGQSLDFSLALSYDQGSNLSPFSFRAGEQASSPITLLSAAFTSGTPAGWVLTNGGLSGGAASTW